MSIKKNVQAMIDTLSSTMIDAAKFDSGVKAAGPRVRKVMQDIKGKAQEVREDVSKLKNAE